MTQDPERLDYVVDAATPPRLAAALVRYRLTRSLSTWVGAAAVVGLAASLAAGQALAAVVFAVVVLATVFTVVTQYRGTARLLAAGAYAPGTPMTALWFDDRLELTTPRASVTHPYADIRTVRAGSAGVTLLVLRTGRQVVVLPGELVGERGRGLLASGVTPPGP